MSKIDKNCRKLLELLDNYGKLTVQEVAELLAISETTARRLFSKMEKQQQLLRVHGGICPLPQQSGGGNYSFRREMQINVIEKQLIGNAAAKLITSGDRIFLDSGTTSRALGAALMERLECETIENLFLITNSLGYTDTLSKVCPIMLTGGVIDSNKMELNGAGTLEALSHFHFTKSFFGTDAVTSDGRLMTLNDDSCRLIKTVIENSQEVIIIADNSKFDKNAFVYSGVLDSPQYTVITDEHAPAHILHLLAERGVKIIIAR